MNILGNLLIAPPAVKNDFWKHSVIIMTEHTVHQSMGLIINKRSEITVKDFGQQLGFTLDLPGYVYGGGPVNNQSLSFLHTNEWSCKNTMCINDKFSVSSADDILPRLAMGDAPLQWRIFLGMCGWQAGQLMAEINGIHPYKKNTSWLLASSDTGLAFETDGKDQWCHAIDRSGSEFAQSILL
jgi:putative transcriptional regulator